MKKLVFHVLERDSERAHLRVGYENAVGGLRTFPGGEISEAPSGGAEAPSGGTGGPEVGPSSNVLLGRASTHSSQTLLDSGDTLTGCRRNY